MWVVFCLVVLVCGLVVVVGGSVRVVFGFVCLECVTVGFVNGFVWVKCGLVLLVCGLVGVNGGFCCLVGVSLFVVSENSFENVLCVLVLYSVKYWF